MDARKRKSQDKVVSALCRLLVNQPLEAITLSAIAAEAGISRQTLYANFSGKEEILEGYMDQWLADLSHSFDTEEARGHTGPESLITAVLTQAMERRGQDFQARRAILSGRAGPAALTRFRESVARLLARQIGLQNGSLRSEDIQAFSVFSAAGVVGVTDAWAGGEIDIPADQLAQMLAQYILAGIGTRI